MGLLRLKKDDNHKENTVGKIAKRRQIRKSKVCHGKTEQMNPLVLNGQKNLSMPLVSIFLITKKVLID